MHMMKRLFRNYLGLASFALLATQIISCSEDAATPDVIASFTYEVDAADYKTVNFSNFSTHFTSLSWDFGDGSAASTEENPSHTYDAEGTYTVTLTATGSGGTDTKSQDVVISDPNVLLTALAGDVSKTWKLLRDASTGRYPLLVGPVAADGSTINGQWWGMGRDNDEISKRSCMLAHEYTFTRDGLTFERNLHGSMWGEGWGSGGQFVNEGICFDTTNPDNMKDKDDGSDLSVWGDFSGTFVLTPGTPSKLKIDGLGAYMGIEKVGTSTEVTVPQTSVTYNIEKLYDGDVDSLIVRVNYKFNAADPLPGGYWMFVFVHYDNPGDEPPIPSPKPIAGFTAVLAGNQLTTTNTTTDGVSYLWDFGDGTTSTAFEPVHTYASNGIYNVRVTATNAAGDNSSGYQMFIVNPTTLTDGLLQGAAWKVQAEEVSLFVGPAMGDPSWYVVPKSDLAAGGTWECLSNDEFTFSAGSVFGYDTKGDVRNDGYFAGFSNGCITDAQLATVTNDGKMFRTFANHSYVFTPAAGSDRAIITVTDGAADAKAFLAFYKAYYGGENSNQANAANGGATSVKYEVMAYVQGTSKEYLFITVDISAAKDGSASWSAIMVR